MDLPPPIVESATDGLTFLCLDALNDIIDELSIGVCFEIHRSIKLNYFHFEQLFESPDPRYIKPNVSLQVDAPKSFPYPSNPTSESTNKLPLCTLPHYDVFGLPLNQKKQIDCACPNCKRTVAATRLAPHLEKCMGMGRSSSRLANRRLTQMHSTNTSSTSLNANLNSLNSVEPSILEAFGIGIDFARNSNSPSSGSEKASTLSRNQRVKHRKQGANGNSGDSGGGGKKKKLSVSQQKLFKAALAILDSATSFPEYLCMNSDKSRKVLAGVCGVLEVHDDIETIPSRMCRRSIRCKVHSDNERREIRSSILENSQPLVMFATNPIKKRDTRKDSGLEMTSSGARNDVTMVVDNLNSNSNSDTVDAFDMPGTEIESSVMDPESEFGSRIGNVFDNLNDWETASSDALGNRVHPLNATLGAESSNSGVNPSSQSSMPVVSFLATKGDLIANSSAQRACNVQSSNSGANSSRAKSKSSKGKRKNQKI